MSETRKRCPNGENYNKETKRCEPKGEMTQRVSTAKVSTTTATSARATSARATSARAKTAKSSSSKSSSSKSSSSKSSSSKSSSPRAKTAKAKPAKASASSSTVEPFILHQGGESFRLLVSVPVNNPVLWPTPNICYFRTTGTSNPGTKIFTGSWFPIVGIKDSSTMPDYLKDKPDGFLIKMGFIMNASDEYSYKHKHPNWISNLIDDYPIILEESEKSFFDESQQSVITIENKEKKSITIKFFIEFIEHNKYQPRTTITDTRYQRIARQIQEVLNEVLKFLNYFLYEWQVMLSLRIGGGYWDLNLTHNIVFKEYISRKLSSFDLVPVPHIDATLKIMSEEKLKEKYFEKDVKRPPNRGELTIDFSKRAGTQLSMEQIDEIKKEEEAKINPGNKDKSKYDVFSEMEKKYILPITRYISLVEQSIAREARLKMLSKRG